MPYGKSVTSFACYFQQILFLFNIIIYDIEEIGMGIRQLINISQILGG